MFVKIVMRTFAVYLIPGLLLAPGLMAADLALSHSSYEKIKFSSMKKKGLFSKKFLTIDGYLLKAGTKGKSPAVVLSPACGGILHVFSGEIRPFYRDMANTLHKAGMTVLLVDGFTPRGFKQICRAGNSSGSLTNSDRAKDSLGALHYLQGRSDILRNKVFFIGYGATGGLRLLGKKPKGASPGFAAGIFFYPKCSDIGFGYKPYAPVQIFVGDKDVWNPPRPCRKLAKRSGSSSAGVRLKVYPDTYHGFVQRLGPRPFHGHPRLGTVTIGGNPKSTADAYRITVEAPDVGRNHDRYPDKP